VQTLHKLRKDFFLQNFTYCEFCVCCNSTHCSPDVYYRKCMCFYSIHMCVCVFVRALLIVKLFSEIKCATSLKVTVGTTIKSMGKIIQSREVKQNFIWIITCRRFAACKRSLNGVEVVISAKLPDNILAHSSTFRR